MLSEQHVLQNMVFFFSFFHCFYSYITLTNKKELAVSDKSLITDTLCKRNSLY